MPRLIVHDFTLSLVSILLLCSCRGKERALVGKWVGTKQITCPVGVPQSPTSGKVHWEVEFRPDGKYFLLRTPDGQETLAEYGDYRIADDELIFTLGDSDFPYAIEAMSPQMLVFTSAGSDGCHDVTTLSR